MIYSEPIAPTVEAIDAWRDQTEANKPAGAHYATEYDHYGVNIWTKSGSCRCITSRVVHAGEVHYWTIRGEGSSNGCRETAIPASKIHRAEGTIVGHRDARFANHESVRA